MNYYVNRVGQVVITYFSAMFVAYALYRLMPGSPLQAIISREVQRWREENPGAPIPIDRIQRIAERQTGINPEHGIFEGYVDYMYGMMVHQEFGRSIAYSEPVWDVIARFLPWSIFISGYGLLFGFSLTLLIGTIMAWKEGSKTDSALTAFLIGTSSVPYFVVAVLMLGLFGFTWEILPSGGRYPATADPGFNIPFMRGVIAHGIMPVTSALLVGLVGALNMRANTVRIVGSEYLRSARLRGLSRNRIVTRYLMRNAVLPIYTQMALSLAAIFSSNVVTEYIFSYPGMGWILLDALEYLDYALLMATFVFFTGITVLGLLIADLTYGLIDPRAGSGATREAF